MRDRFLGDEVWARLELPREAADYVARSDLMLQFRSYLFTRIVPILKDIGLWGPRIRAAFTDMGVIGFADSDLDAEMANDEQAADDLDARMQHVKAVAAEA